MERDAGSEINGKNFENIVLIYDFGVIKLLLWEAVEAFSRKLVDIYILFVINGNF